MKTRFSLRLKVLLLCAACLLLVSWIAVAINALSINILKENMKRDAMLLAREQGERVSRSVERLLDREGRGNLQDLKGGGALQDELEFLLKQNDSILFACFLDSKGNVVIQDYRDPDAPETVLQDPGEEFTSTVDQTTKDRIQVILRKRTPNYQDLKLPVVQGDVPVGHLVFHVSDSKILERIEETSSQISLRLATLTILVLAMVLGFFFLLWRLFQRQLGLQKTNDALDKMAYVGTLASGLAHEIRNPLHSMSVYLEVAKEEIEEPVDGSKERLSSVLDQLRRTLAHLGGTVTNFLHFAHSNEGKLSDFEVLPLIKEILEL
ncbi:MAG: histidine kinase dimerization/phospho-acceptor domain-containing protein, partial [bacterium]